MSDNVTLKTFPHSKTSALTMLYLENQDLSKFSPSELACKYDEAYAEITAHYNEINSQRLKDFYE